MDTFPMTGLETVLSVKFASSPYHLRQLAILCEKSSNYTLQCFLKEKMQRESRKTQVCSTCR